MHFISIVILNYTTTIPSITSIYITMSAPAWSSTMLTTAEKLAFHVPIKLKGVVTMVYPDTNKNNGDKSNKTSIAKVAPVAAHHHREHIGGGHEPKRILGGAPHDQRGCCCQDQDRWSVPHAARPHPHD